MAIQIAKEKKRKELEREAQLQLLQQQQPPPQKLLVPPLQIRVPPLQIRIPPAPQPSMEKSAPTNLEQEEPPQPKKRGRRKKYVEGASPLKQQLQAKIVPPIIINKALITPPPVLNEVAEEKPIIPQENIQVPTVVQDLSGSPPKRRGRGKGKKTLEKEAAAAGGISEGGDSQMSATENTNISTGSADSNPATSLPDTNFQTGKIVLLNNKCHHIININIVHDVIRSIK